MKIALISDIHSNYYALKAVIDNIYSKGIEKIYCAGDIVGYYTMPNETIALLKSESVECVLGNHDYDVLHQKFKDPNAVKCPTIWNYKNLNAESIKFLKSLPDNITFSHNSLNALICHGSPSSRTEYLHQDSIEAEVAIASIDHDILICGHTHLPYYKQYGTQHLINTGSVGKPKNGAPHATYVVLTINETVAVDIVDVEYSFHKTVEHILQFDLPEKNTLALIYGK